MLNQNRNSNRLLGKTSRRDALKSFGLGAAGLASLGGLANKVFARRVDRKSE